MPAEHAPAPVRLQKAISRNGARSSAIPRFLCPWLNGQIASLPNEPLLYRGRKTTSEADCKELKHYYQELRSLPATEEAAQTHDLPRVLGASHATAIVVGTIIGSGIFLVPHEMMRAVGSSGLVYLAWIVGGLLSLFGAMTYAELGAMMPYAGGEYV